MDVLTAMTKDIKECLSGSCTTDDTDNVKEQGIHDALKLHEELKKKEEERKK